MGSEEINLGAEGYTELVNGISELKSLMAYHESFPDAVPDWNREQMLEVIKKMTSKFRDSSLPYVFGFILFLLREEILSLVNQVDDYQAILETWGVLGTTWNDIKLHLNVLKTLKVPLAGLKSLYEAETGQTL